MYVRILATELLLVQKIKLLSKERENFGTLIVVRRLHFG